MARAECRVTLCLSMSGPAGRDRKGEPHPMKRLKLIAASGALVTTMIAGAGTGSARVASPSGTVHQSRPVCGRVAPRYARCDSWVVVDRDGRPLRTLAPSGYGPADLQDAYKLPSSSNGTGQTIAIVDAFDDPKAETDLAVYRSTYGLSACTTANGCFKKVNQNGVQGSYPAGDTGWGQEISLDLDMASAICPGCKHLLAE